MHAVEPVAALDSVKRRVPFNRLTHAGNGPLDECVEVTPDIPFPGRHGRDVGLHRGVAVDLPDLRYSADISEWWAVLGSNQWPLPCETGVGCLRINDIGAVWPIATRTCCHLISLDITQCHDRTVPKLSQRGPSTSCLLTGRGPCRCPRG